MRIDRIKVLVSKDDSWIGEVMQRQRSSGDTRLIEVTGLCLSLCTHINEEGV